MWKRIYSDNSVYGNSWKKSYKGMSLYIYIYIILWHNLENKPISKTLTEIM